MQHRRRESYGQKTSASTSQQVSQDTLLGQPTQPPPPQSHALGKTYTLSSNQHESTSASLKMASDWYYGSGIGYSLFVAPGDQKRWDQLELILPKLIQLQQDISTYIGTNTIDYQDVGELAGIQKDLNSICTTYSGKSVVIKYADSQGLIDTWTDLEQRAGRLHSKTLPEFVAERQRHQEEQLRARQQLKELERKLRQVSSYELGANKQVEEAREQHKNLMLEAQKLLNGTVLGLSDVSLLKDSVESVTKRYDSLSQQESKRRLADRKKQAVLQIQSVGMQLDQALLLPRPGDVMANDHAKLNTLKEAFRPFTHWPGAPSEEDVSKAESLITQAKDRLNTYEQKIVQGAKKHVLPDLKRAILDWTSVQTRQSCFAPAHYQQLQKQAGKFSTLNSLIEQETDAAALNKAWLDFQQVHKIYQEKRREFHTDSLLALDAKTVTDAEKALGPQFGPLIQNVDLSVIDGNDFLHYLASHAAQILPLLGSYKKDFPLKLFNANIANPHMFLALSQFRCKEGDLSQTARLVHNDKSHYFSLNFDHFLDVHFFEYAKADVLKGRTNKVTFFPAGTTADNFVTTYMQPAVDAWPDMANLKAAITEKSDYDHPEVIVVGGLTIQMVLKVKPKGVSTPPSLSIAQFFARAGSPGCLDFDVAEVNMLGSLLELHI